MKISKEELEDRGFCQHKDNCYEFYLDDVMFNNKNNTFYDFCEVLGVGEEIVRVKNKEEFETILDGIEI